jgi:drug/metabolite transporter (DMT)-like permease
MRIGIAFLFLTPLYYRHRKIGFRKHFKGLFLMGVFGNLIPAFLFTKAETMISSSLTGMLNALTPLFTVLVALVWIKMIPSPKKVTGILIGLVSAGCLIIFENTRDLFVNFQYGFLVLLATICYAISINSIRKYLRHLNAVTATVWAFSFIGPLALIYLLGFTEFTSRLHHLMALQSLGYIAILAIAGTALSVMLYNVLIRIAGVIFASSCTYLIPVVAVMWGVFDGENVNFVQVLSIIAIILSVYLINRD